MSSEIGIDEENVGLEELGRQSTDRVLTRLPIADSFAASHALSRLACTALEIDGPEAGHALATQAFSHLILHPADVFDVWTSLYEQGDHDARMEAYQVLAAVQEEDEPHRAADPYSLYRFDIAEKLVRLVEAGDGSLLELARDLADGTINYTRACLLGRLYQQGDHASLGLVLATEPGTDKTDMTTYKCTQRTIAAMASHAAYHSNYDDALALAAVLHDPTQLAQLHATLFASGHTESLQESLFFLITSQSPDHKEGIERILAEAGYLPAIHTIRQRTANSKDNDTRPIYRQILDWQTLHRSDDPTAAEHVAELVNINPTLYMHHLGEVGLHTEQAALARQLLATDLPIEDTEALLNIQFDAEQWSRVFEYTLSQSRNLVKASEQLCCLASYICRIRLEQELQAVLA